MTEPIPSPLVTIDDEWIKSHFDRVVRGSVEETLNALLDAEAIGRQRAFPSRYGTRRSSQSIERFHALTSANNREHDNSGWASNSSSDRAPSRSPSTRHDRRTWNMHTADNMHMASNSIAPASHFRALLHE